MLKLLKLIKKLKRLRVSLKNLLTKPIELFAKNNRAGAVVKGIISSITDFGAFVKIHNIEGLLHNQEVSWNKAETTRSLLKVGDEIEVKILRIDKANDRISLSRKALEESPIENFAKTHQYGDIVEGILKDKKDFGVFISIEENVDALIRLEDLSPLKESEIEKGQLIRAMIIFIDSENNRIRASVKKLERQETNDALKEINKKENTNMTLGDRFKDQLK